MASQQEQVNNALSDAGVDNSNKQIAVTLVWEVACDIDIHVLEPNGNEIYWNNKGPTADSGELDVDDLGDQNSGIHTSGVAIENVSWVTAPSGTYRIAVVNYGKCEPEINYKIYVQIDGEVTIYDRFAPAGDSTKIEVLSFVWQSDRVVTDVNGTNEPPNGTPYKIKPLD